MDTSTDNKPKTPRLPRAQRLRLATQIMAGLLASGHYSERNLYPGAEDQPEEPRLLSWDAGENWESSGRTRRHQRHAVTDALSLLKELEHGLEQDGPKPPKPVVRREPKPVPVVRRDNP